MEFKVPTIEDMVKSVMDQLENVNDHSDKNELMELIEHHKEIVRKIKIEEILKKDKI